jgi:hypothetical protein
MGTELKLLQGFTMRGLVRGYFLVDSDYIQEFTQARG